MVSSFEGYGAHASAYPIPYMTAAVAMGMTEGATHYTITHDHYHCTIAVPSLFIARATNRHEHLIIHLIDNLLDLHNNDKIIK